MILDVLRHGRTATNAEGRFNIGDEPLLPEEVERLRSTGGRTDQYDRVYVSPLRRCLETARALGFGEHEVDARLAERRFGVFEGLTPSESRTRFCDAFELFLRFDADYVPAGGGESRAEHYARVAAWIIEVSQRGDARVLAITHGGTLDFLYRLATARPLHGGDRIFAGDNAAVSTFRLAWPEVQLISFSQPLAS